MKDLSHLPAADKAVGNPPEAEPYFSHLLAEAWAETLDDGSLAMADDRARMRHSWAGGCARQLSYRLIGAEETEPISVADRWRFGLGSIVHERWQEVLQKTFPDAEVEKKVFIEESQSAGHLDLFIDGYRVERGEDGATAKQDRVTLELKTINGFGFKMAIGARGAPEGPRNSAILQCALNGYAVDADRIVIVYLSTENLSPRELAKLGGEPHEWRKFCAEWVLPRDSYYPLAKAEVQRFAKIIEKVDAGELAPRAIPLEIPMGARIVNPLDGSWQQIDKDKNITNAGSWWGCGYCSYQSRCADDMANELRS